MARFDKRCRASASAADKPPLAAGMHKVAYAADIVRRRTNAAAETQADSFIMDSFRGKRQRYSCTCVGTVR
jgi:hypothetical protein